MKSKLIGTALFLFTATTVALYPLYQSSATPQVQPSAVLAPVPQAEVIEAVFVLDTTGSMSGLIQAAKEKIWSIATTMASAQSAPQIRIGLVAFRDRGDAYVTKVVDLSGDLDSMYARLMDFRAAGGGDTPESVNEALRDAVKRISWTAGPGAYKTIFLVGDSPPHMDYQDEVQYPEIVALAKEKGIVVNAIQCGRNGHTTGAWQHIARLGDGGFFRVGQTGNAVAIATPFDEKLADLSKRLDDTRLYYGSSAEREEKKAKIVATEKLHAASSAQSRARRATFNASSSGRANLFGDGDLVDDVASGRVELSTIDRDHLPEPMQAMSPAERELVVEQKSQQRNELQHQIKELAAQRAEYLKQEVRASGGAKDSLDEQIYRTVREQGGKVGLSYDAAAPAY